MSEPEARLPARLEVSALIRRTQDWGGFAAVLKRGDPDSGSILILLRENGGNPGLYERTPQLDGSRKWSLTRQQDVENKAEFEGYLSRRTVQDPDLWLIELDVADSQRLIG